MPTDIERGRPRREAARRNNYTEESSTEDDSESEGGTIDSTNGTEVQELESESEYEATPEKNAGRKGGKGGGRGGRGGTGGNNHAGRGRGRGRGRGGRGARGSGGRANNGRGGRGRGAGRGAGRAANQPRVIERDEYGAIRYTEDGCTFLTDEDPIPEIEEEPDEDEELDPQGWIGLTFDTERNDFVEDECEDIPNSDVPKVEEWNKIHPTEMREVRVMFDGARQIMLGQLVGEYKAFKETLATHDPPIEASSEGLAEHLFSEKSELMHTMMTILDLEYEVVLQFVATFFFACEFGMTAKRLDKHPRVDYEDYMDQKTYNSIWNKIKDSGKDGKNEMIWKAIQSALNKDCQKFFLLTGREETIRLSWDDDKIHFQFDAAEVRKDSLYLVGLKGMQHVQRNCRGFTFDTAASAASGFLFGVSALRQDHKSNVDNYRELINIMFAYRFLVRAALATALNGIWFCSDRGYWVPALMLLVLGYGGTVFGTIKRAPWVPYTYDQKLGKNDKREKINTKYGRSAFAAFGNFGKDVVKVLAWRSGTGSCSLATSSHHNDETAPQVFDFCFKNPGEARWYKSDLSQAERDLKAFRVVSSSANEDEKANIADYIRNSIMGAVRMLTCYDLDKIWFALRMFSWTSSSAAAGIKSAALYIPSDSPIRDDFVTVCRYASLDQHLRDPSENDDDDDDEDESEELQQVNDRLVKTIVQLMRSSPTQTIVNNCSEKAERIVKDLKDGRLSSSTMESMMVALGASRSTLAKWDDDKNKKKLTKWAKSVIALKSSSASDLESSSIVKYDFPYDVLAAVDLERLLRERVGSKKILLSEVPGPHKKPGPRKEHEESLRYLDNNPTECPVQEDDDETDDVKNAIIDAVISRAFLRALEGQEKASTQLGHQNESKYLTKYMKDSQDGRVPGVEIIEIRECGLAAKRDELYVRDSADGFAFERMSDSDRENAALDESFDKFKSHPVECKCRSEAGAQGSLQRAERIQKKIAESQGSDALIAIENGQAIYMRISSGDPMLADLIPDFNERIQILHHAYTYSKDTTTFLVGNAQGKILFGLIVTFEDDLLEKYGSVLKFMYQNGLNLFYEDSVDNVPMELIEGILLSDAKLKKKYQLDDFMTSFLVFRELLPDDGPRCPKFPIPECDMFIPLEHSIWNASMGASDAATRLMMLSKAILPIKAPQCVVVARFLQLYAVVFHRARQAVTGRKEVDVLTDTIKTVRDRMNQRHAFPDSLQFLSSWFIRKMKHHQLEKTKSTSNVATASAPTNETKKKAPRMTQNNQNTRHGTDHTITGEATGNTPIGRGKVKCSELDPDVAKRHANCPGYPVKIFVLDSKKNDGTKVRSRHVCDLCEQAGVSYWCAICKQVLCFDIDRSKRIQQLLKGDKGTYLRKKFPSLAEYGRGDAPPFWYDSGYPVNKKTIFVGKSCYHIAHPVCITINEEVSASMPPSKRSRAGPALESIDENSTLLTPRRC